MSVSLTELFEILAHRRLSVKRTGDESLECIGNLDNLTPEIKRHLQRYRDEFLSMLPIVKSDEEKIADSLAELTSWLNRAMPPNYQLSRNPEFWATFDTDLKAALDAGDPEVLDSLINNPGGQSLKGRCANEFHWSWPRPQEGETLIVYSDHPLLGSGE